MKKRELENNRENSSSVSKKAVERQAHEHASQESSAPDLATRIRTTALPGETVSPQTHATILNRAKAGGSSQTNQVLRQLQRQYGNLYVQRVVSLAKKGEGERDIAPEVEHAIQSKRGGGQDLDKGVRTQMESTFGADFSGVRVHTDGEADTLNRHLNARAFTTSQDIFFRQGNYNPGSSSGRELLAHELTHVVQQSDGLRRKLALGQPGDKYEREADEAARAVIQGEQKTGLQTGQEHVRRQPAEEEEEPLKAKGHDVAIQRQAEEDKENVKNDNNGAVEESPTHEATAPEIPKATYTPEQYYQDAYAWLDMTVSAHDRAINQVEATLQDDADVKIDIFKLALTAVSVPIIKDLGTAFKVTIDISKIYAAMDGATRISFRHFAGNVRSKTEEYQQEMVKLLQEMRNELKKEEASKTNEAQRAEFRNLLAKDAAEKIPEPPSFRDIEKMLFESWINGHKGNWLYKKPGRMVIKYGGGKLTSVDIEDVEGGGNIEREFEDIYKYKKFLINIARFGCEKWLYIGQIIIIVGINNEFIKGHYPVTIGEAIAGKSSTEEAKKYWLQDFGGAKNLPKITKFGQQ